MVWVLASLFIFAFCLVVAVRAVKSKRPAWCIISGFMLMVLPIFDEFVKGR